MYDQVLMIDQIALNSLIEKSKMYEHIKITADFAEIDGEKKAIQFNPVLQKDGSRALINISGPMSPEPNIIEKIIFGATSTNEIMKAVQDVAQDDKIESVVFNINSPGGNAQKIHVLADMIHSLAQSKATASLNSGTMASAAYFVGSQAGAVFVSDKMNLTGSIGTVMFAKDSSKAAEMAGVKVIKVATGPLKGMLQPGTAITADQIQFLQEFVNKLQANFSEAVERTRPADMSDGAKARSGQSFFFEDAKQLGLVDGIKNIAEVFQILDNQNEFKRIKGSL